MNGTDELLPWLERILVEGGQRWEFEKKYSHLAKAGTLKL
jgi:hypothetical protein